MRFIHRLVRRDGIIITNGIPPDAKGDIFVDVEGTRALVDSIGVHDVLLALRGFEIRRHGLVAAYFPELLELV